jgi:hypothetical protein
MNAPYPAGSQPRNPTPAANYTFGVASNPSLDIPYRQHGAFREANAYFGGPAADDNPHQQQNPQHGSASTSYRESPRTLDSRLPPSQQQLRPVPYTSNFAQYAIDRQTSDGRGRTSGGASIPPPTIRLPPGHDLRNQTDGQIVAPSSHQRDSQQLYNTAQRTRTDTSTSSAAASYRGRSNQTLHLPLTTASDPPSPSDGDASEQGGPSGQHPCNLCLPYKYFSKPNTLIRHRESVHGRQEAMEVINGERKWWKAVALMEMIDRKHMKNKELQERLREAVAVAKRVGVNFDGSMTELQKYEGDIIGYAQHWIGGSTCVKCDKVFSRKDAAARKHKCRE